MTSTNVPDDVRAGRKAQTPQNVRCIAPRLFAEQDFDRVTISDIAGEAGIWVQTIFNHFTSKEELFFDGRVDWVSGPADAIRRRDPAVPPLTALREYLAAAA